MSAGNIDFDALGNSITLDASNRVSLSSAISVDSIYQRSTDLTSYLDLPGKLKIRTIQSKNDLEYLFKEFTEL